MAENDPTGKVSGAANVTGEKDPQRCDLRQLYVKDVSFEAPHVPGILFGHDQPVLVFSIDTSHALCVEGRVALGDVFDVTVRVTVEAKAGEKVLFVIEVQQGGLFEVVGYSPEDARRVLRTRAPEAIYPYARELVSSLVTRGGFPNISLRAVNFDAMYAEWLANGGGA